MKLAGARAGALVFLPQRPWQNVHIPAEIHCQVHTKPLAVGTRRLECQDTAASSDTLGEQQRVKAAMRPNIEHGHSGFQEAAPEVALRVLITALQYRAAYEVHLK